MTFNRLKRCVIQLARGFAAGMAEIDAHQGTVTISIEFNAAISHCSVTALPWKSGISVSLSSAADMHSFKHAEIAVAEQWHLAERLP
ncbi:MAG: hypothetical protein R3D67_02025 [Hyphomicrobiaceae bacterium]